MAAAFPQAPRASIPNEAAKTKKKKKKLKDHLWQVQAHNPDTEKLITDYLAEKFPTLSREKAPFCYNGESRPREGFAVPFDVIVFLKKSDIEAKTFTAFHKSWPNMPWTMYKLGRITPPPHLRKPFYRKRGL